MSDEFMRINRRQRQQAAGADVLGSYIPPQDIEAEQSTLGAMLIEKLAIDKASAIIPDAESFYREAHQTLFRTIIAMSLRNEPVDLITVQAELKNHDKLESIGGISYLAVLYDRVPTAVNVEYYAKIVQDKAILRKLISASFEIIGTARGEVDDVGEVISSAQKAVFEVADQYARADKTSQSEQLWHASDRLYDKSSDLAETRRETGEIKAVGVPFPFWLLQKWTRGMQKGLLYILAARPSMGKTLIGLFVLLQAAMRGECILFVSLDNTIDQVTYRCISMISGVTQDMALVTPHLMTPDECERWTEATTLFMGFDFEIYKPVKLTPSGLRSKIQEMHRHGRFPSIVCIDYIQQMRSDTKAERRDIEVGRVVTECKAMGAEMGFALLALAQINRQTEGRDNKRPTIADIRESGVMEAEADVVMLLYREGYYAKKGQIADDAWQDLEIIVGKNKEGGTGITTVEVRLDVGRPREKHAESYYANQASLELTVPDHQIEGTRLPYAVERDESDVPI